MIRCDWLKFEHTRERFPVRVDYDSGTVEIALGKSYGNKCFVGRDARKIRDSAIAYLREATAGKAEVPKECPWEDRDELGEIKGPYVVSTVIEGVEYIRIPDDALTMSGSHPVECKTNWFRKDTDLFVSSKRFPEDTMRCCKCLGTSFDLYFGSDWGGTTCKACNIDRLDLGFAWMEVIFPDYAVRDAVQQWARSRWDPDYPGYVAKKAD